MALKIPKLGNLADLSPSFNQSQKERMEKERNEFLIKSFNRRDSIRAKRKQMFDPDTGTLQMDCRGMAFWLWGNQLIHEMYRQITDGFCCFVDMIGRPVNPKTNREMPLFDYEKEMYMAKYIPSYANPGNDPRRWKHVWVKKGRGAGITDFEIYDSMYLPAAFPDEYDDSQMAIITGIDKQTSNKVIQRMKHKLYQRLNIVTDFSESVLSINNCTIEAYPAKNPNAYRGQPNMKKLFLDEADFGPESIISDTMDALEGYWPKNNPYIIINSTANRPDGLLEQIEKQPLDVCNYKRLFFLADRLEGKIYTKDELQIASLSDSYPREMLGQYKGLRGNLFPKEHLDYASGKVDHIEILDPTTKSVLRRIEREPGELSVKDVVSNYDYMGVNYPTSIGEDPAFNSSKFAFVVTKNIDGIIYAVKEVELDGPSHEEAIQVTKELMYEEFPWRFPKIWVDAANVSYIRALKQELNEYTDYHRYDPKTYIEHMMNPLGMVVCPVAFNKWGDRMNYHFKRMLAMGLYRIDPDVTPYLYVSMNAARYDENKNRFDKQGTPKNDVYDGSRLANCSYEIGGQGVLYV